MIFVYLLYNMRVNAYLNENKNMNPDVCSLSLWVSELFQYLRKKALSIYIVYSFKIKTYTDYM